MYQLMACLCVFAGIIVGVMLTLLAQELWYHADFDNDEEDEEW